MNSVTETSQSWFGLPLLILVSAAVALVVYFVVRRPGSSNNKRAAPWAIFILVAFAGVAAALLLGVAIGPVDLPAALQVGGESVRHASKPLPVQRTECAWQVPASDSRSKWEAYESSIEQAGILPNRPAEKSWVANPTDNRRVGYSVPTVTSEEAMRQARDDAANNVLASLARSYWIHGYQQHGDKLPLPVNDMNLLGKRVIDRNFDGLLVDTYEETIARLLGTVYRAAVQIRVDSKILDHLTDALITEIHGSRVDATAKRRDLISTSISAAALALVVLVLYFFLNAGTKGYFAWPLRFLSLSLLLAIYAGWFYLKGWI